eukprot:398264_1
MTLNVKTCTVLNLDKEESTLSQDKIFANTDESAYIVSEADEELLILIEFTEISQLKNITFCASKYVINSDEKDENDISAPKLVSIYKTKHLNINFDDITSIKPDKTIKLSVNKLNKGQLIKLYTKIQFKYVKYLVIYIQKNQEKTDKTYLNSISFNAVIDSNKYEFNTQDTVQINALNKLVSELNGEDQKQSSMHSPDLLQFIPRVGALDCDHRLNCKHIKIITRMLQKFNKQIKDQQTAADYNVADLLNDYHHLLTYHSSFDFEDIYDKLIKETNDNHKCELSKCWMIRRHHRDRSVCTKRENKLHKLYFTNDPNSILRQQLFDRIHCYYFHSFDTGYKIKKSDRERIMEQEIKINDVGDIDMFTRSKCANLAKMNMFTRSKCANIQNIAHLSRLYSQSKFAAGFESNQRENTSESFDKFSYGIRYFYWDYYKNNNSVYDDVQHNMDDKWVDSTFLIRRNKPRANSGATLKHWYIPKKYSNLKAELTQNAICVIGSYQFDILMLKAIELVKTNMVKSIKCPRTDSIRCYDLLYGSTMNVHHLITLMVYCGYDELQKKLSETYRRENQQETDGNLKKRHQNYYWMGRALRECVECYGIKPEDRPITVYHGVNKPLTFSSAFAFIKGPFSTSTDRQVAVNFCNQGIIVELNINSLHWRYNEFQSGPSGGAHAANSNYIPDRICCFDMQWISDFNNENEIFFIGGLYRFEFKRVQTAFGCDYVKYLRGLKQMTSGMSCGDLPSADNKYRGSIAANGQRILFDNHQNDEDNDYNISETELDGYSKQEQQMVFRLLSHELWRNNIKHKHAHQFELCPGYIKDMLSQHTASIETIFFLNDETENIIHKLFFKYDNQWINLDLLLTVFPNTRNICYNAKKKDLEFLKMKSIYHSVLVHLRNFNKTKIALQYVEILIKSMYKQEIQPFVTDFKIHFKKYGWHIDLVDIKNVHEKVPSEYVLINSKHDKIHAKSRTSIIIYH